MTQIEYQANGRAFGAVFVNPGSIASPRGGVLFFHGGAGIGAHEREQAHRLSVAGFAVLVPDLFGEAFTDRAHGMRVIGELVSDPPILRARTNAALRRFTEITGLANIAAVGHCFGGLAALELARSGAEIPLAVSIHGGLTAREPARRGEVRARVLACVGAEDRFCPPEQRAAFEDEMTRAAVDWQMHLYGGAQHGFTLRDGDSPPRPGCAYHEPSDRRSWRAMLDSLHDVFANVQSSLA